MLPRSLILLALMCGSLVACSSRIGGGSEEDGADQHAAGAPALRFEAACDPGETLTIAAGGDVLVHSALQRQAYRLHGESGFRSLWSGIEDLLAAADMTYLNLEGPIADGVNRSGSPVTDPGPVFDDYVYSSYPMFNYHPSLADDLLAAGVDVVSTANNHSLDRRQLGVVRTLDNLDAAGLPHTGTRRSADDDIWHTVVEERGFSIAWLACTYGTNGLPDRDDQVLHCFSDTEEILEIIGELAGDHDAVIVTPHWGNEYQRSATQAQVELARDFLEAGALAVLGAHPHVLQPWEKYCVGVETEDGECLGREGLIIYSLGNFVSNQSQLPRRSTLLLYLGLTRGSDGKTRINGARYVPMTMLTHSNGDKILEATDRMGGLESSRADTVGLFGEWNVHPADGPVVTNPECDPDWSAPHPHDGWVGGTCSTRDQCGDAECAPEYPGGLCTRSCEGICPDQPGHAWTFCVELAPGEGSCVAQCKHTSECRTGYECRELERFGEPAGSARVCVPADDSGRCEDGETRDCLECGVETCENGAWSGVCTADPATACGGAQTCVAGRCLNLF